MGQTESNTKINCVQITEGVMQQPLTRNIINWADSSKYERISIK